MLNPRYSHFLFLHNTSKIRPGHCYMAYDYPSHLHHVMFLCWYINGHQIRYATLGSSDDVKGGIQRWVWASHTSSNTQAFLCYPSTRNSWAMWWKPSPLLTIRNIGEVHRPIQQKNACSYRDTCTITKRDKTLLFFLMTVTGSVHKNDHPVRNTTVVPSRAEPPTNQNVLYRNIAL